MRITLLVIFYFIVNFIFAQTENVAINNDGTPPNPSAILDINSVNKGITFPRMNTAQRNAIVDPATGLIIYNLETDCIEYYAGLLWLELCGAVAEDNTYPPGIYVSLKEDDIIGDGTPIKPYRTIVKGLEQMQLEDTMRVAIGTFTEMDTTINQKTGFSIIGGYDDVSWKKTGMGDTEITLNTSSNFFINESNNILMKDLKINGNTTSLSNHTSYGLRITNSIGITLDSCSIDS